MALSERRTAAATESSPNDGVLLGGIYESCGNSLAIINLAICLIILEKKACDNEMT